MLLCFRCGRQVSFIDFLYPNMGVGQKMIFSHCSGRSQHQNRSNHSTGNDRHAIDVNSHCPRTVFWPVLHTSNRQIRTKKSIWVAQARLPSTHTYRFTQRTIQCSAIQSAFMKHNFHKEFSTEKRTLTVGVRHRWTLLNNEDNNERLLFINWNTCITDF